VAWRRRLSGWSVSRRRTARQIRRMLISVDARRKWLQRVEKQRNGRKRRPDIDERIQYIGERNWKQRCTRRTKLARVWSKSHNGEILPGQPSYVNPTFRRDRRPLKNHAVSDVSSRVRPSTITIAAARRKIPPNECLTPEGLSSQCLRIRTTSRMVSDGLEIIAIQAMWEPSRRLRLGEDVLQVHSRFGFGQQTGIELPSETRGLTNP